MNCKTLELRNNEALRGAIKAEVRRLMEAGGMFGDSGITYTNMMATSYGSRVYGAKNKDGTPATLADMEAALDARGRIVDLSDQHQQGTFMIKRESVQGSTKEGYTIHASFDGSEPEEVDTADDEDEARYLLQEYRMAYGGNSDVWIEDNWGNKVESVREAVDLSREEERLLDLVRSSPGGYEVGGFGNPVSNSLYRKGLVTITKNDRGVNVLKLVAGQESVRESLGHFTVQVDGDWKAKDGIANALNVKFTGSRWSGSKVFFDDRYPFKEVKDYAEMLAQKYKGQVSFFGEGATESVRASEQAFKVMMYNNPNYGAEEIDTADDRADADHLYSNYASVYRRGLNANDTWLWIEDASGKVTHGTAKESFRYKEQAGSFEDWMRQVDREMIRVSGIGHMDIGDQLWHDWYDDGISPKEAAEDALRSEGFPFQ